MIWGNLIICKHQFHSWGNSRSLSRHVFDPLVLTCLLSPNFPTQVPAGEVIYHFCKQWRQNGTIFKVMSTLTQCKEFWDLTTVLHFCTFSFLCVCNGLILIVVFTLHTHKLQLAILILAVQVKSSGRDVPTALPATTVL